jgi:hypothetical protein
MKTTHWTQVMVVLSLLMLVSCAKMTSLESQKIHTRSISISLPQKIKDLAGPWEYNDAAGQGIIMLNAEGKGDYEWQEGRIETHSLENGTWTGRWIQEENDREGGFTLTFSDDSSVAQGEWWYTRIGEDHDPHQARGTFMMSRPSAVQIQK